MQSLSIKNWADEDKPREKLIAKGKKELTNAELIAILLGSGTTELSAVGLAQKILQSVDNNISALAKLSPTELQRIKGVGEAKAVSVIAALELGFRMLQPINRPEPDLIRNSLDLFGYVSQFLIDQTHEEFWAIYLNVKNKVIHRLRIASGGLTDTTVDTRIIFKTALEKGAVAIAVAHNHPSGSLTPSKPDISLTTNILEAGKILKIKFIDHIIVGITSTGAPNYYSFNDDGKL